MEEKIESDITEIKETMNEMKNGNNGNQNNTDSNTDNKTDSNTNEEKIDCLCPETKKELNESGKE